MKGVSGSVLWVGAGLFEDLTTCSRWCTFAARGIKVQSLQYDGIFCETVMFAFGFGPDC